MSSNVTFKSLLVQADLKLAMCLQAGGAWWFQEAAAMWLGRLPGVMPVLLLFLQNGRGSTYRQKLAEGCSQVWAEGRKYLDSHAV